MDSVDLQVLRSSVAWRKQGHKVVLVTIVETWGSSPRPAGAMLAIRDDGQVAGSVSGGCVEDDLIDKIRNESLKVERPEVVTYGVTKEEAERFGLPCGGTLQLVLEQIQDDASLIELLQRVERHELVSRTLDMNSGGVRLGSASSSDVLAFDGKTLKGVYGPRWRLLIVGAGQLSVYIAQMAPSASDKKQDRSRGMARPTCSLHDRQ